MKKDFHYPVTAEEVTFEGLVRHPIPKGTFTPENSAEKNLWFYTDMQEISQFLGVPLAPVMLDVVGQQVPGSYPIPSDGKVALRNDHLGYAITWFAVGIAGLVIFLLYTRNTRRPA